MRALSSAYESNEGKLQREILASRILPNSLHKVQHGQRNWIIVTKQRRFQNQAYGELNAQFSGAKTRKKSQSRKDRKAKPC